MQSKNYRELFTWFLLTASFALFIWVIPPGKLSTVVDLSRGRWALIGLPLLGFGKFLDSFDVIGKHRLHILTLVIPVAWITVWMLLPDKCIPMFFYEIFSH